MCTNEDLSILLFESLDTDALDRNVQPVSLSNDHGFESVVNSFMNHYSSGAYSVPKRMSRFPAVIEALRKCNR